MTKEALWEGIKRLTERRKGLEPFSEEVIEINAKLQKLWNCYWLMLEQERRA